MIRLIVTYLKYDIYNYYIEMMSHYNSLKINADLQNRMSQEKVIIDYINISHFPIIHSKNCLLEKNILP